VTPAARLQAGIEILDALLASRAPAEKALKTWGAAHRFAGSGDRRAIAERVYACLRHGQVAKNGRGLVAASLTLDDRLEPEAINALFSGQAHGPAPLSDEEIAALKALTPGTVQMGSYIEGQLARTFGKAWPAEARSLMQDRAPLDIRINLAVSYPVAVQARLADLGLEAAPTPFAAAGLRLAGGVDVQALDIFKEGGFEVQDEGSQLVAALCAVRPGDLVVDYCAGGGGKTLALAANLKGGRLIACDIDDRRLAAIAPRLKRAGVKAELRKIGSRGESLDDLNRAADRVLVDAPCSGSGTWRRHPEGARRITPEEINRLAALQLKILTQAANLVKPGGILAYVTCSVLASENSAVVERFEARNQGFAPLPIATALAHTGAAITPSGRERLTALAKAHQLQLSPGRTGTDGFFIALFERRP